MLRINNLLTLMASLFVLGAWLTADHFFKNAKKPEKQVDHPRHNPGWHDQYMAMKSNDEGKIPSGLFNRWHYEEQITQKRTDSTHLGGIRELGPFSLGGRTRAILIDHDDPGHIFAGSVSGGLWQSRDGGKTWKPQNDLASNLSVMTLAQSHQNSNVVYYGTGEAIGSSSEVPGEGIFRSLDGGNSFQPLPNTLNDSFQSVWNIKTAPNQAGVFYAATENGGFFRFSDSGKQLVEVFDGVNAVTDVEVLPDSTVFITVYGRGIFKSENGKPPYKKVNNAFPNGSFARVEMAYCQQKPEVMYAVFSKNARGNGLKGLWKSTDKGKNWQQVRNPDDNPDYEFFQSNYALALEVKPDNPDYVITGCVDAVFSKDGGNSWKKVAESHVDIHKITHFPNNPDRFLMGNDGGIYGYKWANLNNENPINLNEGYRVSQFYTGHYFPDTNKVIGGTQDNGTQGFDWENTANRKFRSYLGGDGAYCVVNQSHPDTGYASQQNGVIFKTTNMTDRNPYFRRAYRDMDRNSDGRIDDQVWFINPFEINPAAENQLYFTTKEKVWITTNHAEDWKPLTDQLIFGTSYNTAISRDQNPVLFMHGNNALFYRMTDPLNSKPGDEVDLTRSVPREVTGHFLRALKIHPEDSSILYGGFSNLEDEPRIWRITKAMSEEPEWQSIHGDLPTFLPVNSLAIHPQKPDSFLIAGTDFGLYVTHDQGKHWVKEKSIPNVSIYDLRLRRTDKNLFIYTHGRGIWEASLPDYKKGNDEKPPDTTNKPEVKQFKVFPNPTSGKLNIRIPFEDQDKKAKGTLYDVKGNKIKEFSLTESRQPQINMEPLPSGTYFLKVKAPENAFLERIILQ